MSNDSDYGKILRGLAYTNPSQAKVDTVHILSGRTSRVPTTTLSSSLVGNVLQRNSLKGTKKFFGNEKVDIRNRAMSNWEVDKSKVYVAYQDMIAPFRQDTQTIVENPTDILSDLEKMSINRIERVYTKEYQKEKNVNARRLYLDPTLNPLGGIESNGYPFVSEFGLLEKCNPRERYLTFVQERYHRYLTNHNAIANDPTNARKINSSLFAELTFQSRKLIIDRNKNKKISERTEIDDVIKTDRLTVGMLNQAHCITSLDDTFLATNDSAGLSSKFDEDLLTLKDSRVLTNDTNSQNSNNVNIKGLVQTINLSPQNMDSFYLRAITTGIPKSVQQSCFGLDIEKYDPKNNNVLNLGKDLFNLPDKKIVFVGDMDLEEKQQWERSKTIASDALKPYDTGEWEHEKSHPKKGNLAKEFTTSKKSWAVSLHSLDATLSGVSRPHEAVLELQYALYDQNNVDRLIETSSNIEDNEFNKSRGVRNARIEDDKKKETITTFFPFVKSFDTPSHFQYVQFSDVMQLLTQTSKVNINKDQVSKILAKFYRLGGSSYFRYINQNNLLIALDSKNFVETIAKQTNDEISTKFVDVKNETKNEAPIMRDGGNCAINIFEKNLRLASSLGKKTTILNFVADDNSKFIDVRLPSPYYKMDNQLFKRRYSYSLAYNTNSNVVLLCSIDTNKNANVYGTNDVLFENASNFKKLLKPSEVKSNSGLKAIHENHIPPSKVLYDIKNDVYQKFKEMLTKSNRFSGKDKEVWRFEKKRNLIDDLLFVLDSNIWDIGYLYDFKNICGTNLKLFCSDVLLDQIDSASNAKNIAYPKDKFNAFRNVMRGSLPIPQGFNVVNSKNGATLSLKPFNYVPKSKTFNPYELFIFDNFSIPNQMNVDTQLKNKITNRMRSNPNVESYLDIALPHSDFNLFFQKNVYDISTSIDIESGYFWKNIKYDILSTSHMDEIKNMHLDCLLPFTTIGQNLYKEGQFLVNGKSKAKLNLNPNILNNQQELPNPKVFDPYDDVEDFIDCLHYYSRMLSNDIDFDVEISKGHKQYDVFTQIGKKTMPFDFLVNTYTNNVDFMDFDSEIKNSFNHLEVKIQSTEASLIKEYYAMRLIALLGCFFSKAISSEIIDSSDYFIAFGRMAKKMFPIGDKFRDLKDTTKTKCLDLQNLLKIGQGSDDTTIGKAFIQFIRCEVQPFVALLKEYGFVSPKMKSDTSKYQDCISRLKDDDRWMNFPIKAFIKNTNNVSDLEAQILYCQLSEADKDKLVDLSQQSSISTLAATLAIISPFLRASEFDIDFLRRTGGMRFMDVIDASGFYKFLEKNYEGTGVDLDTKLDEMENPTSYSGQNQQLEFIVEDNADDGSDKEQNVFDDAKGKKESKLTGAKIATIGLGLLAFSGLAYVGYRVMKKQPIVPTNISNKIKGWKEKPNAKGIKKVGKT